MYVHVAKEQWEGFDWVRWVCGRTEALLIFLLGRILNIGEAILLPAQADMHLCTDEIGLYTYCWKGVVWVELVATSK